MLWLYVRLCESYTYISLLQNIVVMYGSTHKKYCVVVHIPIHAFNKRFYCELVSSLLAFLMQQEKKERSFLKLYLLCAMQDIDWVFYWSKKSSTSFGSGQSRLQSTAKVLYASRFEICKDTFCALKKQLSFCKWKARCTMYMSVYSSSGWIFFSYSIPTLHSCSFLLLLFRTYIIEDCRKNSIRDIHELF